MKYSLDRSITQFIDRLLCDADDLWARYHFAAPEPEAVKSRRGKALAVLGRLVERLPADEFRALRRYVQRPTTKNIDRARKNLWKMVYRGRGRERSFTSWGDCSRATAQIPARRFFAPAH